MALPVAPPPRSNDVVVQGWSALTVRITWTLLTLGVKVRPEVLREARAHVLYHLDPATPLAHAEDLATQLTEQFVARVRGRGDADPAPQDWEMPISPRWRRALERSLDPLGAAVFKKHYGDNRSFRKLEEALDVDRVALDAAVEGLREVVRRIAVTDGLPLDGWSVERIDRLLRRLAAWSPGPCPPVLDVAEGCHREHLAQCPRCDRLSRIVKNGMVEVDDLFAPTVGARPTGRARALVLHLHPDARAARNRLLAELPVQGFALGDDRIVVNAAHLDQVGPFLRMAAEVGLPARDQVRGAVVEGAGAFTNRGLLGPLAERGSREALHRSWGKVDGLGELPPPLPEPPSAAPWWAATGALTIAAAAVLAFALGLSAPVRARGLEAEFTPGRGGIWAAFDVPDEEWVYVIAEDAGGGEGLKVVLASEDAGDKVDWATGDGRYRLHVAGRGVLVAASAAPIPDLPLRVARLQGSGDALSRLADELRAQARVTWTRR